MSQHRYCCVCLLCHVETRLEVCERHGLFSTRVNSCIGAARSWQERGHVALRFSGAVMWRDKFANDFGYGARFLSSSQWSEELSELRAELLRLQVGHLMSMEEWVCMVAEAAAASKGNNAVGPDGGAQRSHQVQYRRAPQENCGGLRGM